MPYDLPPPGRGFWYPASLIGVVVCGALAIYSFMEGNSKDALIFTLFMGVNAWTLQRAKA